MTQKTARPWNQDVTYMTKKVTSYETRLMHAASDEERNFLLPGLRMAKADLDNARKLERRERN